MQTEQDVREARERLFVASLSKVGRERYYAWKERVASYDPDAYFAMVIHSGMFEPSKVDEPIPPAQPRKVEPFKVGVHRKRGKRVDPKKLRAKSR